MFLEQENTHGHLPEYLVRSIKANPEHEWAVYQYLEASERLIQVAGENADVRFYFFEQLTQNLSNQSIDNLQDTLMEEPHQEQDMLTVDPQMLLRQNFPRDDTPPSETIDMSDYLYLDLIADGFADESPAASDPTNKDPSDASFRSPTEYAMPTNPATSLSSSAEPINSSWENKETTPADMQITVDEVRDQDDNLNPPTSQTRDHAEVKENGPTPSSCPSPAVVAKKTHTAEGSARVKSRKLSVRKKANHRQSTQSASGQRLLKPKYPDISNTNSGITMSHQNCPHWVRIDVGYALMWSLFGPGREKALTEDNFKTIFNLVSTIGRHDVESFLETQSNLWQTDRFWTPDPLYFPVTENLSFDRLCLLIFRYLQNLSDGANTDVVRGRLARIRLYLSFSRLFNEKYLQMIADDGFPPNKREVASRVINDLVNTERYQEDSLQEKDRQKFKSDKTHGKKWFLIAHYIGWGALIIWNNDNSKIGKMGYTMLQAFITYIVNVRPDIVALCREYEEPVKALLAGQKPTQRLRQEDVRKTIRLISQEARRVECNPSSWKTVDIDIEVDQSDLTCA